MTPEEAVIGACLLNPDVLPLAMKEVMPSDFETWQGQEIFQALVDLRASGKRPDVVTMTDYLTKRGTKIPAGTLHHLIEQVPTANNVDYYAEIVRDKSIRRGLRTIGSRLAQYAEEEMRPAGATLAEALQGLKTVRDDAPNVGGLHMRKLADVMAESDSYDWVIKQLFERGDRLILTGDEGLGKSMMIRQMAILAAAGIHPFWFTPIPPVRVMVIDRENSERQWRRKARSIWDLAQRFGKPGALRDFELSCELKPLNLARDMDLGKIHRAIDEAAPDLLFIGPLYKLMPGAVQTDTEAAPILAALDSLRERGCVLITEAHAGHERGGSLRPVGSSAFLRWPEFGWGLKKDELVENRVVLTKWRGDRDDRATPRAFMRGKPFPWMTEDVQPGVLERFNTPDGMIDFTQTGRNENGF